MRYLGIDLGGTNIKGAVVDGAGHILREAARPTHAARGAERVADEIAALIAALSDGERFDGVGLGCPGTVDDASGVIRYSANLDWRSFDLRAALRARTGYDVRLANDANAAALAEALVGAAAGAQSAVILTLGTGVGGGVVIEGKLLVGYTGAASELGHMVIVPDGEPCPCGRRGCFERYASATALTRMTREAMAAHPESLMHAVAAELGAVDGRVPFTAAARGDAAGEAVVAQYVRYLAIGVANVVNIFFPEVVALSGGVAEQGEALLAPLRAQVSAWEYGAPYAAKHPRIVRCTLGYRAGVIGAALLCRDKTNEV